ncbi:MAG: hypothetical protein ACYTGP_10790 [Planctomycetota bacterium]|jgi:anti-anti-sigma regulatory factor
MISRDPLAQMLEFDPSGTVLTVMLPADFDALAGEPEEDGHLLNRCQKRVLTWASATRHARVLVRFDLVGLAPSCIFGWLIMLQYGLREHGGALHLSGLRPALRRTVTTLQLDRYLSIHETAADALRASFE